ncbi:hypothetical protein GPA19_05230 [Azoarcus indigens]|uniref:Uncharacterized protein n=1 Tax=Azoarcus indigens TaxID=29545 RepID=A0A4R6DVG3_9RHOO|nr:hypothetical protein [Azoarcus indigens]NMG64347.1 hypothetical protein [Azoarcus indigens]TDN49201.1 hypothetical protein C7389_11252 [Azoarcus indigens]
MNARDLNFPALPAYTADWYAVRFEPMRGTGEAFTCAILLRDAVGVEVRQVIRDDILAALFGQYAGHVQRMIDVVLDSLRAFAVDHDPAQWAPPLTGFWLSERRRGASHAERAGIYRQAIQLSAAFAQLDYAPQEQDEQPALEAARTFIGRVRDRVRSVRADLEVYFQRQARIVPNGSLVQFGFLMPTRAAHFEVLRPSTLSTSVRFARGKLYELKKARPLVPLERAALIVGVPHRDDLGFSERQHAAIERELGELRQEAQEDDTEVLAAVNDPEAAQHIIDIST